MRKTQNAWGFSLIWCFRGFDALLCDVGLFNNNVDAVLVRKQVLVLKVNKFY